MNKIIFVIDANDGPCVRSLCGAMASRGWTVVCFRPYNLLYYLKVLKLPLRKLSGWIKAGDGIYEKYVNIFGFGVFRKLSLDLIDSLLCKADINFGSPEAIIYTLPFYADLAERHDDVKQIYFAYDPYRLYQGWDEASINKLEERIIKAASSVCSISRELQNDFKMKNIPAEYLPNACDGIPLTKDRVAVPDAMKDISAPVIGCVGLSGDGYDWDLVMKMAKQNPGANFVFIGNLPAEKVLADTRQHPNISFTGHLERAVTKACIAHFDICLNPMLINDFNDRRCPLRLYDYLCTDVPVLSTAIREAVELKPHVAVGGGHDECLAILKDILAGSYKADLEARKAYMIKNTWADRAKQMEKIIESIAVPE